MARLATARTGRPRRTLAPPLTPRARRRDVTSGRRLAVAVAAAALLAWELLARTGVIPATFFPPPTTVARALVDATVSGDLPDHLRATLARLLLGLALGAPPAVLAGLAMGWSRRLLAFADPFIAALHPVPKLALLPLLMLLLGIGEAARVAVVAAALFFPILINAMAGVSQIRRPHIDTGVNYGAGRASLLRHVIIPASLPLLLAGFRIGTNLGLLVTIAVEMTAADTGLGALIWLSWQVLRIEQLYATLFVIGLLGLTVNAGLDWVARRLPGGVPEPHHSA